MFVLVILFNTVSLQWLLLEMQLLLGDIWQVCFDTFWMPNKEEIAEQEVKHYLSVLLQ